MMRNTLTFHESMEIHEMLNFKTICMTTSKLAQGVVFDQELKALLDKDVPAGFHSFTGTYQGTP